MKRYLIHSTDEIHTKYLNHLGPYSQNFLSQIRKNFVTLGPLYRDIFKIKSVF
jgi:hypothetical protein